MKELNREERHKEALKLSKEKSPYELARALVEAKNDIVVAAKSSCRE